MSAAATRARCLRYGGSGASTARCATAYERGVVLGGISAGMICWFEYGITDSVPGARCRPCRAWVGSPGARARTTTAKRSAARPFIDCWPGRIPPGYAADDGAALHFVDESLAEVVVAKAGAACVSGVPRWAGRGRSEAACAGVEQLVKAPPEAALRAASPRGQPPWGGPAALVPGAALPHSSARALPLERLPIDLARAGLRQRFEVLDHPRIL